MPRRIISMIAICGAALAVSAPLTSTASASGSSPTVSHGPSTGDHSTPVPVHSCYSQLDNDNGVGVVSQKFESEYEEYRSRGADDFTLDTGCSIQSVDAVGQYFNGSGPAKLVEVQFYSDDNGTPGTPIAARIRSESNLHDANGVFHIPFFHPVNLDPGTYWISVRVRMDFGSGGEWGWNTNNTQRGNPAMWKNFPDGFGTGCTNYGVLTTCVVAAEGPDFTFSINDSQ